MLCESLHVVDTEAEETRNIRRGAVPQPNPNDLRWKSAYNEARREVLVNQQLHDCAND
jgi:hypothetical protein